MLQNTHVSTIVLDFLNRKHFEQGNVELGVKWHSKGEPLEN